MQVQTVTEQLYFTTVLITARNDERSWTGTGFIHGVDVEGGELLHVLVTNKHVLDGAKRVVFRMSRAAADGTGLRLGAPVRHTISEMEPEIWTGHPHDDVDVAVFPFAPVLMALHGRGDVPFFRSVNSSLFLGGEDAAVDTVDAIEPVTFIGYPSGLFDRANFLPIARRGWTATPVAVRFNGLPAFLVDAAVFPGSSGSPVFLLETGMYAPRGGATRPGARCIFLGVLSAVHSREVHGSVIEVPTALAVTTTEMIDLGIVYNATAVTETVDAMLGQLGMARAAAGRADAEPGEVTPADVSASLRIGPLDRATSDG